MLLIIESFFITFICYFIAKRLSRYFSRVPVLVLGMFCVIAMLTLVRLPYDAYSQGTHDIFGRLLGYVTVALAIPLATMRYDDLPLKSLSGILCFASLSAVVLPVSLAYVLHMAHPTILAFTTRAVTTPIAINIANLVGSPVSLVILIVILSGLIGASFSSLILKNIHDERASGLALGLAAHAIGTVQAWQRGPVAGRYAAFGMAVNGVFTAIWLPLAFHLLQ
ncbi:LrgB family protein [Acinetobacter sp. MD2(2019)]|uniref:LrgB family protein n=1 Tax=Acinetobacter sp. MD2(2019) TaxID=2605273 RepID=UPI002D1ED711|nr:LrgB family protein [Acinetobacter sp. MD2(2019)]MEB3754545.1 LrgB family protein [Acinetobacter sp. MD2(2019)]